MSLGARIAIAAISLVCALMFVLTALDPSGLPAGALVFYGLAAFCVIIAVACLFPKSHPITLRLIGALVCSAYIVYMVDSFQTQNFGRAAVGFLVWGLPSGYLAVAGKYPAWGTGAAGFNGADAKKGRNQRSRS